MKTYKLTKKDIKEINFNVVDQLIKELHRLLQGKGVKHHV